MLAAISGQGSWIPDGTACELNIFVKSMGWVWRPRPELNRSTRFCRPLRNHSATWPHETDLLQTIKGLGNLLRRVRRQFLKSGFNAGWHRPRQFTKKARQPCRAFPRSGSRRPRLPSVKMVVHADAGDVF